MRVLLVLFVVTSVAWAKPYPQFGQVVSNLVNAARGAFITRYNSDNDGTGPYSYNYETSNGIKQEEVGEVRNVGREDESIAVTGHYSYVGDDGKTYDVKYTADENGFQPEGDHLPPSAGVKKPKLGVPSAAVASLVGR